MKQLFIGLLLTLTSLSTWAACNKTQSIGADYFGAKYNCEAVIGGFAQNCQPGSAQGSIWYCQCFLGCNGSPGQNTNKPPKFQSTIGADYFGAKYNCEAVLGGYAISCQPGNAQGTIWNCRCQL